MSLTKSLHTVTAVANVARLLLTMSRANYGDDYAALARDALEALGYPYTVTGFDTARRNDPTVGAIAARCVTILRGDAS